MSGMELVDEFGMIKLHRIQVDDDIDCIIRSNGGDIKEIEIGNISEAIALTENQLEEIYNSIIRCGGFN